MPKMLPTGLPLLDQALGELPPDLVENNLPGLKGKILRELQKEDNKGGQIVPMVARLVVSRPGPVKDALREMVKDQQLIAWIGDRGAIYYRHPRFGLAPADPSESPPLSEVELRAALRADWLRVQVGRLPPRLLVVAHEPAPGQIRAYAPVGRDFGGCHMLVAPCDIQGGKWMLASYCVGLPVETHVVVLDDNKAPPRTEAPFVRESYAEGLPLELAARLRELVAPALCAVMVRAAKDLWDGDVRGDSLLYEALWPGGFALATADEVRSDPVRYSVRLWGTGPLLVRMDSPVYASLDEAVAELRRLEGSEPLSLAALHAAGYRT